jgi:hypothetical protein
VGPSCHQFPLHRTPRADRNCAARKAPVVAESMGPTRPPIKQNPELRNNSSIPYVRRHHNSTYGFEPEITVRAGRGLRTTRRRGNLRPVLLGGGRGGFAVPLGGGRCHVEGYFGLGSSKSLVGAPLPPRHHALAATSSSTSSLLVISPP